MTFAMGDSLHQLMTSQPQATVGYRLLDIDHLQAPACDLFTLCCTEEDVFFLFLVMLGDVFLFPFVASFIQSINL